MSFLPLPRWIACLAVVLFLLPPLAADEGGDQLLNLPVPEDGTRYDSYEEFDGPRWPAEYGDAHVALWKDDKLAAYSVTIDDNNSPDFPFWLEVAEEYGWKFTWFVIVHPYVWDIHEDKPGTNTGYFGTLSEFGELAAKGHDIQLHGACAEMNHLTSEAYADHVDRSTRVLEAATGKPILTYAYPCGVTRSKDKAHDYRAVMEERMIAARGTAGGVTPVHLLDYLGTNSLGGNLLEEGNPGRLFARYKEKRNFRYSQYRGWCVTLYHKAGEGLRPRIRELFDWVKAREDEFWVAPFTEVAKYAQERESATFTVKEVRPDRIVFDLTDRMKDEIFDVPLTVKVRLSDSWSSIRAGQGGREIPARLITHEGGRFALVDAVPDRGEVVLVP